MFKLDVVNGMNRLTEDDICCQLKRIQMIAEENKLSDAGVGILTSLPRNQWARSREKLARGMILCYSVQPHIFCTITVKILMMSSFIHR